MRGVFTTVKFLRNEIFKNITVAAYEGWTKEQIENIPNEILVDGAPNYRDTVEREREIVRARIKAALNMEMGSRFDEHFIEEDLEVLKHKKVSKDLVTVIPQACEKCPEKSFFVTMILEETGVVGFILVMISIVSLYLCAWRQNALIFIATFSTFLLINCGEATIFSPSALGGIGWIISMATLRMRV